jgi:C1A family cysteine protease
LPIILRFGCELFYLFSLGSNLDHAALAVGYGVERGIPYWLIKNSWSKAWGESGYIKIAQRNNNCGVTSKAVVVRIK